MSTEEKIIKNKVGLLKLAEMLGSVSEACKVWLLASSKRFVESSGSTTAKARRWLMLCDSSPAHLGCRQDWHCRIVLARPRISYKRQPAHLAATILPWLPVPDYRDTPETAE